MPIYLQYGDIKGDVTEAAHVDWIELTSASFGTVQHAPGGPTGHTIHEIFVTKDTDRASSALWREALNGTGVTATIDFAASDGHVTLTVKMTGTLISSFNVSGHGSNSTEQLTLNFTGVAFVRS